MTTPTKPTNSDLAEQLAPAKPGYQTSEFWLTVVTSTFALLAAFGVIGPDWAKLHEQAVQALALLAAALAPGLYAIARGITKHAQAGAAASVLNQRIAYGQEAPVTPTPTVRRRAARAAGFALLSLIGAILLVVGVILLIAAAADGANHFAPYLPGIILAAIGLVLLWVDGGFYGRRTTRF